MLFIVSYLQCTGTPQDILLKLKNEKHGVYSLARLWGFLPRESTHGANTLDTSVRFFNMRIQSKVLYHTPAMGTYSSYRLGYMSRTDG